MDAFREEVREFIRRALPADIARRGRTGLHSSRDDQRRWGRILADRSWSAPAWPQSMGGAGWSPLQVQIFDEECYLAGAPELSWNGVRLLGPVIYTFGTEEQKRRFLPPILHWEVFWGQGFSEPDAGSDLASLKTRAVAAGDHYIVNGSKIWMTNGHFADWIFCLVRTSTAGKKQEGISLLLIDAHSPGVEIRRIATIDGQDGVSQVLLSDVHVPQENRVGEEGAAWGYAKFLLANERTSSAEVPRCKFYLQRLWQLARTRERNGQPLGKDAEFASRLASAEIALLSLEASVQEVAVRSVDPASSASLADASVLKLAGSHLLQEMGELMVSAIGADSVYDCTAVDEEQKPVVGAEVTGIVADYLYRRAATIYGGSAEIQRNIIAAQLLRP